MKIAEGVEPDRKAAREWLRSVKGSLIKTGETVTIAGHELDVIDVNCPIPPEAVRNQFRNMKLTRSSRRLRRAPAGGRGRGDAARRRRAGRRRREAAAPTTQQRILESIPQLMIKLFERCIPLSRVNSLL